MARKKEAKCCFRDNAIVTALFPQVQHDFLCVVALKYYTVNTERTQKFWMCKSNYHIINTKVAKLQDYNTTIWVLRPLKIFNTLPTHGFLAGHQPRRQAVPATSVRPVIFIQLRVVVRVAVLHGNASGQDRGHVIPNRLALGFLLTLLLYFFQLNS